MFNDFTTSGKFYKKAVVGLILLTVIATAGFYAFLTNNSSRRSKASVGDFASVIFEPASTTVTQGQEYKTTFKFEASSRPITMVGYELLATFDKSKLIVTHVTYEQASPSAGLGNTDADLAAINSTGKIYYTSELNTTFTKIPDIGSALVTVTYKVNDMGATAQIPNFSTNFNVTGNFIELNSDASLSYFKINDTYFTVQTANFTPPPATTTPGSGTGTVTPAPTCVPPPACLFANPACDMPITSDMCPVGNTTVTMKLRFQGITTKPANTTPMKVSVKLASSATGKSYAQTVDFTSDASGIWTGTMTFQLPPDLTAAKTTYSAYIKGPRHLKKRICTNPPKEAAPGTYSCGKDGITLITGANTLDFSSVYQLAGDLPLPKNGSVQSGLIDADDTSYMQLHYGDTSAEALNTADLNLDKNIDAQDFSLILAALGIKYDDPEE